MKGNSIVESVGSVHGSLGLAVGDGDVGEDPLVGIVKGTD